MVSLTILGIDFMRQLCTCPESGYTLYYILPALIFFSLQERNEKDKEILNGLVLAYRKKYKEAARAWARAGRQELALGMYTELRMFDHGQEFVSGKLSIVCYILLKHFLFHQLESLKKLNKTHLKIINKEFK